MKTIFQRIIDNEVSAHKVFENNNIVAFKDIAPVAPVHILIVPKKPLTGIGQMQESDIPLIGEMLLVAKQLAEQFNLEEGYRILTNNGEEAGQTIFHLHFHLIGGRRLGPLA